MKRLLRALFGVAVMTVAAASAHGADDWMNLATVSMTNATTPKLTSRYVCYTDGKDKPTPKPPSTSPAPSSTPASSPTSPTAA